jgi:hypothetical protein
LRNRQHDRENHGDHDDADDHAMADLPHPSERLCKFSAEPADGFVRRRGATRPEFD